MKWCVEGFLLAEWLRWQTALLEDFFLSLTCLLVNVAGAYDTRFMS